VLAKLWRIVEGKLPLVMDELWEGLEDFLVGGATFIVALLAFLGIIAVLIAFLIFLFCTPIGWVLLYLDARRRGQKNAIKKIRGV